MMKEFIRGWRGHCKDMGKNWKNTLLWVIAFFVFVRMYERDNSDVVPSLLMAFVMYLYIRRQDKLG